MKVVAHLTSSPFFGGPERQMLGLALALPPSVRSVFLLFDEQGKQKPFAEQIRSRGVEAVELGKNVPHFWAMSREIAGRLKGLGVDVLCCHGYKADLVGLTAARAAGVPIVSVSRGWTAHTLKVRLYDWLDRACLRKMDRVVCVSAGQEAKVRRAGVPAGKSVVIRNSIDAERFEGVDAVYRDRLLSLFPRPPARVVGAAGRLSPEKGFGVLVDAAAVVARADPGVGFVLFGDGPQREMLGRRIASRGLQGRFVLAGFRPDVFKYMPFWDLSVLSSYTEGLPNVVLESYAAGTPVVATDVGGLPEVVDHGVDGFIVPPGDPAAMAERILATLALGGGGRAMGLKGRDRVRTRFTYAAQAALYFELFEGLVSRRGESRFVGVMT